MTKLAYKNMLKDDEIELFIRTYCTFHDGWILKREKYSEFTWTNDSCWCLETIDYGYIASFSLKPILKYILKVDRINFHTWKNPAEMRIWFDMNKISKL